MCLYNRFLNPNTMLFPTTKDVFLLFYIWKDWIFNYSIQQMAFPAKKYNKWHSQLKKYNIWHFQLKKLQQMASMHLFKLKKRIDELVVNECISDHTCTISCFTYHYLFVVYLASQLWLNLAIFLPDKWSSFIGTISIYKCKTAASKSSPTKPCPKHAGSPQKDFVQLN